MRGDESFSKVERDSLLAVSDSFSFLLNKSDVELEEDSIVKKFDDQARRGGGFQMSRSDVGRLVVELSKEGREKERRLMVSAIDETIDSTGDRDELSETPGELKPDMVFLNSLRDQFSTGNRPDNITYFPKDED